MSEKYDIPTIIHLLRESVRDPKDDKLMQDAAAALAEEHEYANLWRDFEEYVDKVDDDIIERTDRQIINSTEGNADLGTSSVSGNWEIIFESFLDVVKKKILKWPEYNKVK